MKAMKEPAPSIIDSTKLSYRNIIDGVMQPWVMRFIKDVGKGINEFDMIRDGEKILIGVSGGKDSLALSMALSVRRKWLPITYSLHAVMIDWKAVPLSYSSSLGNVHSSHVTCLISRPAVLGVYLSSPSDVTLKILLSRSLLSTS